MCVKNTKQLHKSCTGPPRGLMRKQLPPLLAMENEIPDKSILENKPDHRDTTWDCDGKDKTVKANTTVSRGR